MRLRSSELWPRRPEFRLRPRPLARLLRSTGFEVVSVRQSKIPPGQQHGRQRAAEALAMGALDAVNLAITRAFNALGDRVVVVARAVGG